MSIIDELLKVDPNEIKTPKSEVIIKLKKLGNKEFIFPIEAIHPAVMGEIKEDAMEMTGGKKGKIDMSMAVYDTQCRTIIEGCPTVFKNENLLKKFSCHSGKELIAKLMITGEIDKLNDAIEELSGYDEEEAKKKIKN